MMEAISSSDTSVLTRATRRNNSEDDILHSHRRETKNVKSVGILTAEPGLVLEAKKDFDYASETVALVPSFSVTQCCSCAGADV
jgi:hypothetical protein